jgi:hypothetical protein
MFSAVKKVLLMKLIVSFFLTILLSFAVALFFPWWIMAVVAFAVAAVIHLRPLASFISGFLALFILWGAQAIYLDAKNQHLLATKIASVLPLGGSYIALILLTAFIGGLVAGMAALTASFLRRTPGKKVVVENGHETRKRVMLKERNL